MKMNHHYGELKASYLFVDIAHKVAAYQEAHPEKEIIRLGIGDVTQPLAKCVVTAMQDAAAEMGTKEGFHGYGPEQGYPFLKQAIQATTQAAAPSWLRTRSLSPTVPRVTWPMCWACLMWTTPFWFPTRVPHLCGRQRDRRPQDHLRPHQPGERLPGDAR